MHSKKTNLTFDFHDNILKNVKTLHVFDRTQKYKNGIDEHITIPLNIIELSSEIEKFYLNQLPKNILDLEIPDIFLIHINCPNVINPMVSPHIDYKRTCALNAYIKTNNEETIFYEWDNKNKKCIEVESFLAKNGECWLLDTSAIHSVKFSPNTERFAISFSFKNISYEKLEKII